jgi:hypothetical protein
MGLEPATFTLARIKPTITSDAKTAFTDSAQPDCTPDCTSDARTGNTSPPSDGDGGFAVALAMLAALPLSDAEKAEAVRRLLAGKAEGGKP